MKISKLFHWLYAILMLLPFAFFVPSVFYYAFNDNATMQSVEVPKTETIAVDFNQKVQNGNFVYNTDWASIVGEATSLNFNNDLEVTLIDDTFSYWQYGVYQILDEYIVGHKYQLRVNIQSNDFNDYRVEFGGGNTNVLVNGTNNLQFVYLDDLNRQILFYPIGNYNVNTKFTLTFVNLFDLTQMFGSGNEPTVAEFNLMFPMDYYSYIESQPMQITYDTGDTYQLVQNTDIVNYAWESIWDLPLFSWTKVTFVSVPFSYLTGIFGIGANNSLNFVFGYFVTISIVWLVFDLLLYVPMLAHNWIDKARIE